MSKIISIAFLFIFQNSSFWLLFCTNFLFYFQLRALPGEVLQDHVRRAGGLRARQDRGRLRRQVPLVDARAASAPFPRMRTNDPRERERARLLPQHEKKERARNFTIEIKKPHPTSIRLSAAAHTGQRIYENGPARGAVQQQQQVPNPLRRL